MALFRIRDTGETVTRQEYAARRPNVSFPENFTPPNADPVTDLAPPVLAPGQTASRGAVTQDLNGTWQYGWTIAAMTPEQTAAANAALIAALIAALEAQYDAVARTKKYDNRISCALRAGYPGPFRAEGQAFGTWMDGCNALAYGVIAGVTAGTRSVPTFEQLLAMMPAIVWPN